VNRVSRSPISIGKAPAHPSGAAPADREILSTMKPAWPPWERCSMLCGCAPPWARPCAWPPRSTSTWIPPAVVRDQDRQGRGRHHHFHRHQAIDTSRCCSPLPAFHLREAAHLPGYTSPCSASSTLSTDRRPGVHNSCATTRPATENGSPAHCSLPKAQPARPAV